MSNKKLKSIVKTKSQELLPDFLSCLIRRRRTWDMVAAENGIKTEEDLAAFLEKHSAMFSFSEEFYNLTKELSNDSRNKKKKVEKKIAEVSVEETSESAPEINGDEEVKELLFEAQALHSNPDDDANIDAASDTDTQDATEKEAVDSTLVVDKKIRKKKS
jgi:hypothetical protein